MVVERHQRRLCPELTPEPAVARALRVLDHHRPVADAGRVRVGVAHRRRCEPFLDDHCAVGDRAGSFAGEPPDHARRVVDPRRLVRAVVGVVDPGSGVADALVAAPTQLHIRACLQEREQPFLIVGELFGQDSRGKGQSTLRRALAAERVRRLSQWRRPAQHQAGTYNREHERAHGDLQRAERRQSGCLPGRSSRRRAKDGLPKPAKRAKAVRKPGSPKSSRGNGRCRDLAGTRRDGVAVVRLSCPWWWQRDVSCRAHSGDRGCQYAGQFTMTLSKALEFLSRGEVLNIIRKARKNELPMYRERFHARVPDPGDMLRHSTLKDIAFMLVEPPSAFTDAWIGTSRSSGRAGSTRTKMPTNKSTSCWRSWTRSRLRSNGSSNHGRALPDS